MLLVFWGAVKREMWLYCEPWALHFLIFMSLKIYLSYRHFLFVFFLLSHKKKYFSSSHRPTPKRGTGITVAASNSMIFAIRLASDLIHRKRLLTGCFLLSLQGFRAACHYYFFLDVQIFLDCANFCAVWLFQGFPPPFLDLLVCNKINKINSSSLFFKYNVFSSTGDFLCFEYNNMGLKL